MIRSPELKPIIRIFSPSDHQNFEEEKKAVENDEEHISSLNQGPIIDDVTFSFLEKSQKSKSKPNAKSNKKDPRRLNKDKNINPGVFHFRVQR